MILNRLRSLLGLAFDDFKLIQRRRERGDGGIPPLLLKNMTETFSDFGLSFLRFWEVLSPIWDGVYRYTFCVIRLGNQLLK